MAYESNYHVHFQIAAEFREKLKRTKEDFGSAGMFFSCETLRGIVDFPVLDQHYFEKTNFNQYDVIIVHGLLTCRSGRMGLEPRDFVLAEGSDLMTQAEKMIEYGLVEGHVFAARRGYVRAEDDVTIPRVEVKGMGFVDVFEDSEVYIKLPPDGGTVNMRYLANIELDTKFERRNGELYRRNNWVLSNRRLELVRAVPRKAARAENEAK